jgi:histidine phosphotransferase ChpT
MTDSIDLRLAEMLSARLCHELVAPVGAIGNGLELLALDPATPDPEVMALIEESGRRAAGRLKFYRMAYGFAGDDAPVEAAVLRDLVDGFLEGSRVSVDWPDGLPSLPHSAARLLLNLLVMAGQALPRGGTVLLGGDVRAVSQGEPVDLQASHWPVAAAAQANALDIAGLDAHGVHAAFTGRLAKACGASLSAKGDATGRLVFAAAF